MNNFDTAVEYITAQFALGAREVGLSYDRETCELLQMWAAEQGHEATLSRRGDRIAVKQVAS